MLTTQELQALDLKSLVLERVRVGSQITRNKLYNLDTKALNNYFRRIEYVIKQKQN